MAHAVMTIFAGAGGGWYKKYRVTGMYKYERIVYWSEEDNAFLVEVPELAGCMADGETLEEAMKNCDVIIQEWIDVARERGQEIPEPRGKLMYA